MTWSKWSRVPTGVMGTEQLRLSFGGPIVSLHDASQTPVSAEAISTAQRQQEAEDDFLLADTSGDGLVDEEELLVLCQKLLVRKSQKWVEESRLAKYLLRFRTEPATPLNLDFDAFVGVYNSILSAQASGALARLK